MAVVDQSPEAIANRLAALAMSAYEMKVPRPRPTPELEQRLFEIIQEGNDGDTGYLDKPVDVLLQDEQFVALYSAEATGSRVAWDRLLTERQTVLGVIAGCYERLVLLIARASWRSLDLEQRVEGAMFGLFRAVGAFAPELGYRFTAFAGGHVRGGVDQVFRRATGYGSGMRRDIVGTLYVIAAYMQVHHEPPDADQLTAQLMVNAIDRPYVAYSSIRRMVAMYTSGELNRLEPAPLDDAYGDKTPAASGDVAGSVFDATDVDQHRLAEWLRGIGLIVERDQLVAAIGALPREARQVINQYYLDTLDGNDAGRSAAAKALQGALSELKRVLLEREASENMRPEILEALGKLTVLGAEFAEVAALSDDEFEHRFAAAAWSHDKVRLCALRVMTRTEIVARVGLSKQRIKQILDELDEKEPGLVSAHREALDIVGGLAQRTQAAMEAIERGELYDEIAARLHVTRYFIEQCAKRYRASRGMTWQNKVQVERAAYENEATRRVREWIDNNPPRSFYHGISSR